jgi:chromosome segregation ATPase
VPLSARSPFKTPTRRGDGVRGFDAPFAKASPAAVAAAAIDSKAEAAFAKAEAKRLRAEKEEAERDARRARAEVAAAAAAADAEATERAARERERLKDALARADEETRVALADLKKTQSDAERQVTAALDRADEREKALRADIARCARERDDARRRVDAATTELADVKKSRATLGGMTGAEASAAVAVARYRAEADRAKSRLEELEDERFELRRALEAHVGALVEAKVDGAEHQGTILELRKELSRAKTKYQRAAARSTKLEAMYYTLKDASDAKAKAESATWGGSASGHGGGVGRGHGGNGSPDENDEKRRTPVVLSTRPRLFSP